MEAAPGGVSLRKPVRLGIDGSGLLRAKYGAGRYLGGFLMDFAKHPELRTHLIGAGDDLDVFRKRYRNTPVVVVDAAEIASDALDVVWYPYGVMPFSTDAVELLTLHDLGVHASPPEGFWEARRARATFMRAVRSAERIIAFSAWSAGKISSELDVHPDDIAIVPPLPDSGFSPGPQELKHEGVADMPFVLTVSGWKKHHDTGLVIDAFFKGFRKEEMQLVVVGPLGDDDRAALERVPHHAHIDAMLDDGALRSLYRNAAVVAHPAFKSHWSQTAAEALACGRVLVTANSGAAAQIARDQGMLLPADDLDAWTEGLLDAAYDDELAASLRAAAAAGWGKLSRRTSIDAMIALMHKLLE